ncbi:hypothetical protein LY28_02175 [Ruminiclostridium sufflavum DSM 19573]|uniref:Uncharacterized protein n=1 Tax=Ruminiclostridium sufflavum DSM 19573 TaxID=1121337 RepID=A0A318XJ97_9FIRM|nr:hypothetical protein [Ruminiclostridium sufflavum]PYG87270.1 hypothetical protein LY28_02175 [Ruminiclostridium sufflavum DSM 19573]
MSIKAWGIFQLYNSDFSIQEKVELAFVATIIATEHKIGLKLGGNVEPHILRNIGNLEGKIPFELTDDPLDVNAHCLFVGDGIEVLVAENRVDTGESLVARMERIQNFFTEMLMNKAIKSIKLFLNVEEGDEVDTLDVSVSEFSKKMVELYEQEGNWTPIVKAIIT